MLRILYYLCTKSGKISAKTGVGLHYVMGIHYVFYGIWHCNMHVIGIIIYAFLSMCSRHCELAALGACLSHTVFQKK